MTQQCLCQKDADGRCEKCIESIKALVTQVLSIQLEGFRKLSEIQSSWSNPCRGCSKDNIDGAVAAAVRTIADGLDFLKTQEGRQAFLGIAHQMMNSYLQENPNMKWPLTEKALQEAM